VERRLANLWAQYKARADKHAQEGKRDEQLLVPLVAGGISGVAVRPAVGDQSADFRQATEQAVEQVEG
jgi:hypothetical protein